MEEEAPGTGHRRIVAIPVGTGLLAGAAVLGVVGALSRCWSARFAYNQGLLGVGITQTFVSILLVLFFAGFLAACASTASRSARLLSALLAGATAGVVARTLLFAGDPAYLLQSLAAAPGQVLLLVGGAMLVAGIGGLVASFLGSERPYRDLLPVAAVAVAFIVAPPLLATAGIVAGVIPSAPYSGVAAGEPNATLRSVAGVIPSAPYSGGAPAQETDVLVLKVSAAGDVEWEAWVDIAAYDQPDVLIEYPGGYALAVTEYGREGSTAHILTYDEHRDACGRLVVKAGYGRVTALVPADGGGFLVATEMPGLVRVGARGEVLWERSFAGEDQGMVPVSLLAQNGQYVAAWEDKVACFDENGTRLWQTALDAAGGIGYHPVYPAPEGGVLVFAEGPDVFSGDRFVVYLQAVRLDENGTVLWTRDFGSDGLNELLGVRETAPGEFAVLYRSVTHSRNFWGGTERVSHGHLATLNDDGEVTGHHAIEGSDGAVIPAENGHLSVNAADKGVTLVGRDITGHEIWRQAKPIDLHSFRGIGTADGGYLIAGSANA